MTETCSLLDWVRKTPLSLGAFEEALSATSEIPFDWEELSMHLAQKLGLPSFSIEPARLERRSFPLLKEGLGEEPWMLAFALAPLPGYAFWLMSKGDLHKWLSWIWKEEPFLSSTLLQEGFYRYMALESLASLQQLDLFSACTLSLNEEAVLPEEGAFILDLGLHSQGKTAWGRLVLSFDLLARWKELHASPLRHLSQNKARAISLTASLIQDSLSLTPKELRSLKKGDLLLLNPASTPYLALGTIPLFQALLEEGRIRLMEHARIYQDKEFMEKNEPSFDAIHTEETLTSIKEVPLTVTIELARLRLTLDALLQLEPGATLDVTIAPHPTVSLILNGQKIGSGELISLGDVVGVRLLTLGKP